MILSATQKNSCTNYIAMCLTKTLLQESKLKQKLYFSETSRKQLLHLSAWSNIWWIDTIWEVLFLPSFSSSSSSSPWQPGQLCAHRPMSWGWPHIHLSAAASRLDACLSFDQLVFYSLLHLLPEAKMVRGKQRWSVKTTLPHLLRKRLIPIHHIYTYAF